MRFRPRTAHLAAAALAIAASLLVAPSAAAHPLGAPQTLQLSADQHRVWIRWSAAADDLTALGLHLGVLGNARRFVYDRGVLVPEQSDASDPALLSEAPQLPAYLFEHIRVAQSGQPCSGEVATTRELAEGGAVQMEFVCPSEVEQVTVDVSTLTDLHPAYRTMATSAGSQREIYTREDATHQWQLGTTSDEPGQVAAPAGLGIFLAGVGGSYFVLRRRRAASRAAGR